MLEKYETCPESNLRPRAHHLAYSLKVLSLDSLGIAARDLLFHLFLDAHLLHLFPTFLSHFFHLPPNFLTSSSILPRLTGDRRSLKAKNCSEVLYIYARSANLSCLV